MKRRLAAAGLAAVLAGGGLLVCGAAGQGLPPDPPSEALERRQVETKLAQFQQQHQTHQDPLKALAQEHQRRMKESRERRAARRKAREEARRKSLAAWAAKRQATIIHLGAGVSANLGNTVSDVTRLTSSGLPVLHEGRELAAALGVTLGKLRWLTFHRKGATVVHYHRYDVPKKSGGTRHISAPKPDLKQAQAWVWRDILEKVELHPQAHGFRPRHSIVSNAVPHVGRKVVANLDLKDFFPSITFPRVQGLFRSFGYSPQVSTILALLCTEPPRAVASIRGRRYYVAVDERALPQGACTSPAITNILCRALDRRLQALAAKLGFAYTRYADDLTFSGDDPAAIGSLLGRVRQIIVDEGFEENAAKGRVMRRSRHQEVTGVTVNQRPKLSRKELRILRAILHNAAKHGLESQNRTGHPNFAAYLKGRVGLACMIDPDRAPAWNAALAKALGP